MPLQLSPIRANCILNALSIKIKIRFIFKMSDKSAKVLALLALFGGGGAYFFWNKNEKRKKACKKWFKCNETKSTLDTTGCKFPFKYQGKTYTECTTDGPDTLPGFRPLWCSTKVDSNNQHVSGNFKTCTSADSDCDSELEDLATDCSDVSVSEESVESLDYQEIRVKSELEPYLTTSCSLEAHTASVKKSYDAKTTTNSVGGNFEFENETFADIQKFVLKGNKYCTVTFHESPHNEKGLGQTVHVNKTEGTADMIIEKDDQFWPDFQPQSFTLYSGDEIPYISTGSDTLQPCFKCSVAYNNNLLDLEEEHWGAWVEPPGKAIGTETALSGAEIGTEGTGTSDDTTGSGDGVSGAPPAATSDEPTPAVAPYPSECEESFIYVDASTGKRKDDIEYGDPAKGYAGCVSGKQAPWCAIRVVPFRVKKENGRQEEFKTPNVYREVGAMKNQFPGNKTPYGWRYCS
tara:strand:+ start:1091 stop:2476 length:1386 start_codon:yes stop_codon:yes gene_type:complete